jgi:hypothetical protein
MSSFRNKSSTKHIISHFSSTDPKHIETDWTLDLDYPQPILSKNIFFERDQDVICCITNGDKVSLDSVHVPFFFNEIDNQYHLFF